MQVLLNLLAGVALLVWGTHIVRTGIMRTWGGELRRVLANLQLGLNVFINGDLKSAQRLISEKEQFRNLERAYADNHLQRLVENTLQSIETSALHLDIIRDLKRINSHICSIAYPILESAGVLAPTRLRESKRRSRSSAPAANGKGKPLDPSLNSDVPKA